jgi:hypothetical protein
VTPCDLVINFTEKPAISGFNQNGGCSHCRIDDYHLPEDDNHHSHSRENLKSYIVELLNRMDLEKMRCEDVRWMELAQDRVQWRALLLAVLNLRVLLPES